MDIVVVPREGKRHTLTIMVDEEEWRHIHTDIFGKSVQIPFAQTTADLQEAFTRLELQGTRKYVLNKLAQRQLSLLRARSLAHRAPRLRNHPQRHPRRMPSKRLHQ